MSTIIQGNKYEPKLFWKMRSIVFLTLNIYAYSKMYFILTSRSKIQFQREKKSGRKNAHKV